MFDSFKRVPHLLDGFFGRLLHNAPAQASLQPELNVVAPPGSSAGLTYARGFLLFRGHHAPKSVSTWARRTVGDWDLRIDPRVPIDEAKDPTREVWIIGDAFHPSAGQFSHMAKWTLEGDLEHKLEGLSGRFVVIYKRGKRIEVYHDALGARSVFYGEGVVASHASLAAEVAGAGLRDWILPFITSRAYIKRDVKYLPGLDSPFEGIAQLTPNCKLRLQDMTPERYWPRSPKHEVTAEMALEALLIHLKGMTSYFQQNRLSPIVGLTGGTDSRGVLAALVDLEPKLFTIVRSRDGRAEKSRDSLVAGNLAACAGINLEIVKVVAPAPLDNASSEFAKSFRWNTGQVRGANASWLERCIDLESSDRIFVRGFGGEVMRGFYRRMEDFGTEGLSRLYDVNANSKMSVDAFERFSHLAGWSGIERMGYHPDEMLYWEHRMGIWGSSALTESDMVFRSMPGYNSRELYAAFMGLPPEVDRRALCHEAISRLAPRFNRVEYAG